MLAVVLLFLLLLLVAVFALGRLKRSQRLKPKPVPFLRTQDDVEVDSEKIKVVVTGGCGCVGREIIRQLLATCRYAVYCLDIFIPPEDKRIAGVISYIQADIANFSDVSRALQGMEVVFHTASLMPVSILNTPEAMERVNVKGTRNIIQACKQAGVKRLIYTSSVTVLLSQDRTLDTELMDEFVPIPTKPVNAYVRTKGQAELAVREATGEDGLSACAVRLGVLVGRGSYIATSLMKNSPMLGDGDIMFSWTSLKSAGEVHLLAERYLATKSVSAHSNVFNVVSINSKYKDFMSCFSFQNTGKDIPKAPIWLCKVLIAINEFFFWFTGLTPLGIEVHGDVSNFLISNSYSSEHTEKELGWVDKRSLKQVVDDCIAECKQTDQSTSYS